MSIRGMSRDVRQMARQYIKNGWLVTPKNGGHYRWTHPNGGFTFSESTASDHRGILNLKSRLKRIERNGGYHVDKDKSNAIRGNVATVSTAAV